MNTQKPRAFLLMGALLIQSFFLSTIPHTVRATSNPAPNSTEARLIISAVQITGGPGRTHEDFIELYNPTDQPFDLNGHRLVKRTATGTTDISLQSWSDAKVVPPYSFFLWANSNFTSIAITPDASSSGTLADNNGIAIRRGSNDTGEILDSAAWGSTANIFTSISLENPTASNSLIRKELLEQTSNYELQPSSPRNSLVEFLPESPEESEPADETDPSHEPKAEEQEETSSEDHQLETETPEEEAEEVQDEDVDETDTETEIETAVEAEEVDLRINELLPNPTGSDTGAEKIEIYNAGNESVNLLNYRLDDVSAADPISSNAFTFPSVELAAKSYYVLTIPVGKFSLNNTSGDVVTLFNANGEDIDTVSYIESTPEAKSFSYFESGWEWAGLTFGQSNGNPPIEQEEEDEESEEENEEESEDLGDYDNSSLEIGEIYPDPVTGANEFVEIYNAGEEVAQLSQVTIWVGDKSKSLSTKALQPGEYYVVAQEDLPAQLRNSGQEVKLQDGSTVLSTVTYPLAIDGSSFARFEDGFLWTTSVTQGEANVLKLPEVVKKEAAQTAAKTAATKAVTTKAATKTTSKAVAAKATAKPAVTLSKAETAPKPEDNNPAPAEEKKTSEVKQKESMGKIIAMGAAAVAAGVIALYKLVFTSGIE